MHLIIVSFLGCMSCFYLGNVSLKWITKEAIKEKDTEKLKKILKVNRYTTTDEILNKEVDIEGALKASLVFSIFVFIIDIILY